MIESIKRSGWDPIPRDGVVGVTGNVLLIREGLLIAHLKFEEHATIDEHSAPYEIDVICLAGRGHMSIGNQRFEFKQDERAVWPRGIDHRLWTEDTTMETLMVERYES
ncbi:MAG: hypothetical protein O7C67_14245 [Gammaproteobacteria bacterium]|nr:hypothetical protein [Gammaproteobacteria bacterium]